MKIKYLLFNENDQVVGGAQTIEELKRYAQTLHEYYIMMGRYSEKGLKPYLQVQWDGEVGFLVQDTAPYPTLPVFYIKLG